jgi:hypothetical protein
MNEQEELIQKVQLHVTELEELLDGQMATTRRVT